MNLRSAIGAVAAMFCVVALSVADDPPQPKTPPPQPAPMHTSDSLETVKNKLELKEAILLDVRGKDEWEEGRLAQARHVPLNDIQEGLKPDALPKDKIIYTHCASGRRALIAQELLKKQGYDVRALKEGYRDLLEAGFEEAPAEEEKPR
ncbi:MAG: rhodanese-like domain-containing protein [Planctomycetes bacterium]|nr:rhodanese-like domain-containing protein [Planctomycetota bacterium]